MDQFEKLFEEWIESQEEYKNSFAKDGIIDEPEWQQTSPKILFIMKETNGFSGDLRELIRDKSNQNQFYDNFWHNIGRWGYGINNCGQCELSYPSYTEANKDENKIKAIKGAAIINLKKSKGGGSADNDKVKEAALRDQRLIVREFDLIEPNIVVCGNIFDIVRQVLGYDTFAEVPDSDEILYVRQNVLFINSYHPACYYPPKYLYHTICSVYRRYLQSLR